MIPGLRFLSEKVTNFKLCIISKLYYSKGGVLPPPPQRVIPGQVAGFPVEDAAAGSLADTLMDSSIGPQVCTSPFFHTAWSPGQFRKTFSLASTCLEWSKPSSVSRV